MYLDITDIRVHDLVYELLRLNVQLCAVFNISIIIALDHPNLS